MKFPKFGLLRLRIIQYWENQNKNDNLISNQKLLRSFLGISKILRTSLSFTKFLCNSWSCLELIETILYRSLNYPKSLNIPLFIEATLKISEEIAVSTIA